MTSSRRSWHVVHTAAVVIGATALVAVGAAAVVALATLVLRMAPLLRAGTTMLASRARARRNRSVGRSEQHRLRQVEQHLGREPQRQATCQADLRSRKFASPSQADDGTVVALGDDNHLYRFSRAGRQIGKPVPTGSGSAAAGLRRPLPRPCLARRQRRSRSPFSTRGPRPSHGQLEGRRNHELLLCQPLHAARRARPRQGLGQPGLDRQPAHGDVQPRRRRFPERRQRRLPRARPRGPERSRRHAPRLHVVRRPGRLLHRLRRHHPQRRQAGRRRRRLRRHPHDPPLLDRRPTPLQGRRPNYRCRLTNPPGRRLRIRQLVTRRTDRSPTRPAATSTRSTSARSRPAAAASRSRVSWSPAAPRPPGGPRRDEPEPDHPAGRRRVDAAEPRHGRAVPDGRVVDAELRADRHDRRLHRLRRPVAQPGARRRLGSGLRDPHSLRAATAAPHDLATGSRVCNRRPSLPSPSHPPRSPRRSGATANWWQGLPSCSQSCLRCIQRAGSSFIEADRRNRCWG